jgi:hypothetical protein
MPRAGPSDHTAPTINLDSSGYIGVRIIKGRSLRPTIDRGLVLFHRLPLDFVILLEIDPVFDVLADADFLLMV